MKWIGRLLRGGENFLALRKGGAIGHVAFMPESTLSDGEYLIFVAREDRNRGVGSQLTHMAVEHAASLGLNKIWLTVGTYNFIAIRLYKKFGFEFVDAATPVRKTDGPVVVNEI